MPRQTGTLELLVHAHQDGAAFEFVVLLVKGAPPGCEVRVQERLLEDVPEMGDWECKPLASMPDAAGLWVLVWPWQMIEHPEDPEYSETVKYAVSRWRRPTLEDLAPLLGASAPAAVAVVSA